MKKHWKSIILICSLVIAVCIGSLSLGVASVKAGFGDFNDYDFDDWGSSDWGSSSSDWGSSSSDWGSSSYYDGGSGDGDLGSFETVIVFMVIMFICIMAFSAKGKGLTKTTNTPPVGRVPKSQPPKMLPQRNAEVSSAVQREDPNFTSTDFLTYVRQVYMDIQTAWEKRDLNPVRAVLHQNLYQQTQRQIEKKIADGIVNHLERISINTAYLTSYVQDEEYEYIGVYMAASMIDYQVKEATGQIVMGDTMTRWNMFYKMTFMRSRGNLTRSARDKDQGIMCPNCGAPLKGTSFGVCEYCDSVVLTGIYDWVLSEFGVVKMDTVDEGIRLYEKPVKAKAPSQAQQTMGQQIQQPPVQQEQSKDQPPM